VRCNASPPVQSDQAGIAVESVRCRYLRRLSWVGVIQLDIQQAIVGGISVALASQAGKPKGGCERDGCDPKKDFVAFLFIHYNMLEAL
jgi:hypothetical protein